LQTFENQSVLDSKPQDVLMDKTYLADIEPNEYGNWDNTFNWENICYVSVGMVLQANELLNKGEFIKEDLIADTKDKIHSKKYVEAKWIKKYDIEKYKYLEWNTNRVPDKIRRPTFPELYIPSKIILGGMTGGIFDNEEILCNHSCYISVLWKDLNGVENRSINNSISKDFEIKGDKKQLKKFRKELEENSQLFDLKYMLSILNSKYGFYYLNSVRRSQLGFYPDDLKKLPIKFIPMPMQKQFSKIVDYVMFLKQQKLTTLEDQRMPLYFEHILDAMVYELYFEEQVKLSRREIIAHIEPLPSIDLSANVQNNMSILRKVSNEIYQTDHPVRNTVTFIQNVDGINKIEKSLKSNLSWIRK